jgi:hypothetical protein
MDLGSPIMRRGAAVLAAAALLAVGVAATGPATAAAFLTKKKAVKLFAKKKSVYTKAQVDAMFGTTSYRTAPFIVPFNGIGFGEVACPPGTAAVGGGASQDAPNTVVLSVPTDGTGTFVSQAGAAGAGTRGWGVAVADFLMAGPTAARVWAICQGAGQIDADFPSGSTVFPKAGGGLRMPSPAA